MGRGAKVRARDLRFSYTSSREVVFFYLTFGNESIHTVSVLSSVVTLLVADIEYVTVFIQAVIWTFTSPPNHA